MESATINNGIQQDFKGLKSDFDKRYKNIKKIENALLLTNVGSTAFALVFIHLFAWLLIYGVFKNNKLAIARVIEITALALSASGLMIGLFTLFYVARKKEELHGKSGEIIQYLEKEVNALNGNLGEYSDSIKKVGTRDDSVLLMKGERGKIENHLSCKNELDEKKAILENFKKIQQSFAPPDKFARYSRNLGIAASVVFTAVEIPAVIQLFKDFGFDKWHGTLPINFQGVVDSIAIVSIVVASSLRLRSAINRKFEDNATLKSEVISNDGHTSEKKESTFNLALLKEKEILLPTIALVAVAINLIGKVIQGMEAAGSIKLRLSNGNIFSVGFTIRMVVVLISLSLAVREVASVMDKSVDSELRIDSSSRVSRGLAVDH